MTLQRAQHGQLPVLARGGYLRPGGRQGPDGADVRQQVQMRLVGGPDHRPGRQQAQAFGDRRHDRGAGRVAAGDQPWPRHTATCRTRRYSVRRLIFDRPRYWYSRGTVHGPGRSSSARILAASRLPPPSGPSAAGPIVQARHPAGVEAGDPAAHRGRVAVRQRGDPRRRWALQRQQHHHRPRRRPPRAPQQGA